MTSDFRFPLYVFRRAVNPGIVFKERGGKIQLLLFTSAEKANIYRQRESLDVQIVRLRTASELRDWVAAQVVAAETKVVLDPIGESVPTA